MDAVSSNEPPAFEATFILDGVRYQYGFELTSQRVTSEHLLVYKTFKPQQWFERSYNPETGQDRYEFGSGLTCQKSVCKATRPNSLFLSTAVQLNSEQLRPIFDWFINNLVFFNEFAQLNPQLTVDMLRQPEGKQLFAIFSRLRTSVLPTLTWLPIG